MVPLDVFSQAPLTIGHAASAGRRRDRRALAEIVR
jgi:hypothetical protein